MKIISKYKDYYDYLSGVWGEDPKLILERTKEFIWDSPSTKSKHVLTFVIGGNMIQLYYSGENYYFGKDLKQFDTSNKWNNKEGHYRINIGYEDERQNYMYAANGVKSGYEFLNDKYNCPVLYTYTIWHCSDITKEDFSTYPLLSSTPVTKFVDATDVYRWIQEYLARKVDQSQARQDNLSDVQRLVNKGFDKVTSFRPKINV